MDINVSDDALGAFPWLPFAIAALGLFSAIFWMVVGWCAMRAHERLADNLRMLIDRREQQ